MPVPAETPPGRVILSNCGCCHRCYSSPRLEKFQRKSARRRCAVRSCGRAAVLLPFLLRRLPTSPSKHGPFQTSPPGPSTARHKPTMLSLPPTATRPSRELRQRIPQLRGDDWPPTTESVNAVRRLLFGVPRRRPVAQPAQIRRLDAVAGIVHAGAAFTILERTNKLWGSHRTPMEGRRRRRTSKSAGANSIDCLPTAMHPTVAESVLPDAYARRGGTYRTDVHKAPPGGFGERENGLSSPPAVQMARDRPAESCKAPRV